MYYETLADELLHIRANLLRVPAHQKLSNMLRGELFVLNYLHDHDTIVREPDSEDSRQIIVHLTSDGEHVIQKCKEEVLYYLARTLEILGPDDAREYIRIQKKIYCNYIEK